MKKQLAAVTAMVILTSAIPSFTASAANLAVGTRQDFESAINTGDSYVTMSSDEKYGGVLKFSSDANTAGGQVVFDFPEGVKSGTYLLSFDALMSSTSANLLMHTNTYDSSTSSWSSMSFMALREGGKVTAYPNNQWSFPQIGTATFEAGKWQRYDVMLDFDGGYADVYIDGVEKGSFNLTNNGITGMNKIHFVFADYGKTGQYAMLDNLDFKKYTYSATMTAKRTLQGNFEAEFSETMNPLQASDFVLTRDNIATEEVESEAVNFTLSYTTPTKAVIVPASKDGGYTYTLSLANSGMTTAFDSRVTGSYSVTVGTAEQVDKEWNFEDGVAIGNNTKVVDEGDRGKVLKSEAESNIELLLDNALSSGKYIYSYDLKIDDTNYMHIRAYSNTDRKSFEAVWDTGAFGNSSASGWGITQLGGQEVTSGKWYRIDNVMDMDGKTAYVYCDGKYLGSIDLAEKDLNEFKGVLLSVNGAGEEFNPGYFDNVRIRTLQETAGAKLTVVGNKMYIDFDETVTGLTDADFTVTKSSGIFSGSTIVPATVTYQNGARAVLTLGEDVVDGNVYTVKLNNLKTFIGTPVVPSLQCDLSGTGGAKSETVVNDDMSSYTTENVLAAGSKWSLNNSDYADRLTAADGAVTAKSDDIYAMMFYNFGNVIGDTVEIETTLNITPKNADTKAGEILFKDQNGQQFSIAEIKPNYILQVNASSTSSGEKAWSGNATWEDHDYNKYTSGTDFKLKIVMDLNTKKIQVYNNGTKVVDNYPWWKGSDTAEDITGISGLIFYPQNGGSITVKDIKVVNNYTSAVLGGMTFEDADGVVYDASNVSAKATKMNIIYPAGMKNDTFNGNVAITCGGENVNYVGTWNSASNTYTLAFDKPLGTSKTYSININGSVGRNGEIYAAQSGNVTTNNDKVFAISALNFTKTGAGIDVTFNCLNTKADETAYLIYAGYNGNRMTAMNYERLDLTNGGTVAKSHTFTDANIGTYDKVTVFIWDGFTNMEPLTNAVTK